MKVNWLRKINKLKHLESVILTYEDYNCAEVWRIVDKLILFEIPSCGCSPLYYSVHSNGKEIVEKIKNWMC